MKKGREKTARSGNSKLSYERVINALTSLGLIRKDAEIYVYLASKGPKETAEIAENLKMSRQQVHFNLQNLQDRKIVFPIPEHITKFGAVPFEKTMMLLMKAEREEAKRLEQSKAVILAQWLSLMRNNTERKSNEANF